MSVDFLAAEPLVIARLKEKVPGFLRVLGAAGLSTLEEASQTTPAAHVYLETYQAVKAPMLGTVQFEQRWVVVVVVRNVADAGGEAARQDAGPLLSGVAHALLGWKPHPELAELAAAPNPRPVFFPSGLALLPLAFTTRLVERGTP